ncbi:MAG: hypothetical protein QXD48_01000 [Candidatus Aenigmatarchaeota archaeon]
MKLLTIKILILFIFIIPIISFAYSDTSINEVLKRSSSLSTSTILNIKNKIENEFGKNSVLRWDAYLNPNNKIKCFKVANFYFTPDEEHIKRIIGYLYDASESASKNNYGISISPEFVYTVGMGEGLVLYLKDLFCGWIYENDPVDGFYYLGLDHFSDEVEILKSNKFLRRDFNEGDEYFPVKNKNELDQIVRSAEFKNIKYGLEALAARIAWTKYVFLNDLKKLNIPESSLTEDQINFWVYYYYNIGNNKGYSSLTNRIKNGILDDSNFIRATGKEVKNGCNGRYNAIIRTATTKFIKNLNIFNPA